MMRPKEIFGLHLGGLGNYGFFRTFNMLRLPNCRRVVGEAGRGGGLLVLRRH